MALATPSNSSSCTGVSPYPVERTLLTTGILEAAVRFCAAAAPISTPHLNIRYQTSDYRALREMGASWQILTEDARETVGFAARPLRR